MERLPQVRQGLFHYFIFLGNTEQYWASPQRWVLALCNIYSLFPAKQYGPDSRISLWCVGEGPGEGRREFSQYNRILEYGVHGMDVRPRNRVTDPPQISVPEHGGSQRPVSRSPTALIRGRSQFPLPYSLPARPMAKPGKILSHFIIIRPFFPEVRLELWPFLPKPPSTRVLQSRESGLSYMVLPLILERNKGLIYLMVLTEFTLPLAHDS